MTLINALNKISFADPDLLLFVPLAFYPNAEKYIKVTSSLPICHLPWNDKPSPQHSGHRNSPPLSGAARNCPSPMPLPLLSSLSARWGRERRVRKQHPTLPVLNAGRAWEERWSPWTSPPLCCSSLPSSCHTLSSSSHHLAFPLSWSPQNSPFPNNRGYLACPLNPCRSHPHQLLSAGKFCMAPFPGVLLAWHQCGAGGVRPDPTSLCISPQQKLNTMLLQYRIIALFLQGNVRGNKHRSYKLRRDFSSRLPLIHSHVIPKGREWYYGESQPHSFITQLLESSSEVAQLLNPDSQKVPPPDWWAKKGCRRHQKRQSRNTLSSPGGFLSSSYRIPACSHHNFSPQHFPAS